jgi:hypothetical protein
LRHRRYYLRDGIELESIASLASVGKQFVNAGEVIRWLEAGSATNQTNFIQMQIVNYEMI